MAHLKTDTSSNAHFAQVPQISHSRNSFSIAERHLTTMQYDIIYPIWQKYIYPGDTISIQHQALARLQTQITTLFDDLYFDIHAWFVPFRLLQDNWARFQFNAQPLGPTQDNSSLTTPRIEINTTPNNKFLAKTIYDYLGFPTNIAIDQLEHLNAFAPLAYNLIWNENYRDQNLQSPVYFNPALDYHNMSNFTLLKRGKRHDVFTSCLPFQQKGTASTIPFNLGTLDVTRVNNASGQLWKKAGTNTNAGAGSPVSMLAGGTITTASDNLALDPNGTLKVVGGFLSAFTVNELRLSVAVQQLLESDARGGTRDVEAIKHRWGVTVPDFRLQRPEYLGGQTFSFDGHIVPQTSASANGSTPQANLAQFSQTTNRFSVTHSFVEHGIMMIMISARSNITYQQGMPKEYRYKTRFDMYQPEFANLGEVAVKNGELYYSGNLTQDNAVFGYQEYGYELRYGLNRISAEFRSNYAQSLDIKHMADDYASLPTLGPAWIQSNTPISRNIAVSATLADPIELNTMVQGTIARTLPMYSIPGLDKL